MLCCDHSHLCYLPCISVLLGSWFSKSRVLSLSMCNFSWGLNEEVSQVVFISAFWCGVSLRQTVCVPTFLCGKNTTKSSYGLCNSSEFRVFVKIFVPFIYCVCACLCVGTRVVVREQLTVLSFCHVPLGIKFRSSGLTASIFTC